MISVTARGETAARDCIQHPPVRGQLSFTSYAEFMRGYRLSLSGDPAVLDQAAQHLSNAVSRGPLFPLAHAVLSFVCEGHSSLLRKRHLEGRPQSLTEKPRLILVDASVWIDFFSSSPGRAGTELLKMGAARRKKIEARAAELIAEEMSDSVNDRTKLLAPGFSATDKKAIQMFVATWSHRARGVSTIPEVDSTTRRTGALQILAPDLGLTRKFRRARERIKYWLRLGVQVSASASEVTIRASHGARGVQHGDNARPISMQGVYGVIRGVEAMPFTIARNGGIRKLALIASYACIPAPEAVQHLYTMNAAINNATRGEGHRAGVRSIVIFC